MTWGEKRFLNTQTMQRKSLMNLAKEKLTTFSHQKTPQIEWKKKKKQKQQQIEKSFHNTYNQAEERKIHAKNIFKCIKISKK